MDKNLINFKKFETFDMEIIRKKNYFKTQSLLFYNNIKKLLFEYDMINDTITINKNIIYLRFNYIKKDLNKLDIDFIFNKITYDFELYFKNGSIIHGNLRKNGEEKNFNFIKINDLYLSKNIDSFKKSSKNIQVIEDNKLVLKFFKHKKNTFRILFDTYNYDETSEEMLIYVILTSLLFKKFD